jgi:hypothetical protein
MDEKPRLVLTKYSKDEPIAYTCSLCGQPFLFPEDRRPKEGTAELWAAFQEHVREEHPDEHHGT